MTYIHNNTIWWTFEKAFDQLTNKGRELFDVPFHIIKNKTFNNSYIIETINKLTCIPKNDIIIYLSNLNFQEAFLLEKIKKKLYVHIILNNFDRFISLVNYGYKIDTTCLILAIINNHFTFLQQIICTQQIKLTSELLMYCLDDGYENIYFYLRNQNLLPNISIYYKAALGNSLEIIKDISNSIGISNKVIENALVTNNTKISIFLLEQLLKENIIFDKNLFIYPIINCNYEIINILEFNKLITWHHELYYSAILSGSLDMCHFIESKIPDIHKNKILDTSKYKKGWVTLLLKDMMYQIGTKKFFSHTINYAIQSKSIKMVEYIHNMGYGLTISNFITAIRQSTPDILNYLCKHSNIKSLPYYFIHYFSIYSFASDKIEKFKILMAYNLINFKSCKKLQLEDYKNESVHIDLILESKYHPDDCYNDIDFLMNYSMFFKASEKIKYNYKLLTKVRLFIELEYDTELETICSNQTITDQQIIINALFLFGNTKQIKKIYPLIPTKLCPDHQIILELISYSHIGKLCCLLHNNLFNFDLSKYIYPTVSMLSNPIIDNFFHHNFTYIPNIIYIAKSKNIEKIKIYLDSYQINNILSITTIKDLLILDNIDIVKQIIIPKDIIYELIPWCKKNDLFEICTYLSDLANML